MPPTEQLTAALSRITTLATGLKAAVAAVGGLVLAAIVCPDPLHLTLPFYVSGSILAGLFLGIYWVEGQPPARFVQTRRHSLVPIILGFLATVVVSVMFGHTRAGRDALLGPTAWAVGPCATLCTNLGHTLASCPQQVILEQIDALRDTPSEIPYTACYGTQYRLILLCYVAACLSFVGGVAVLLGTVVAQPSPAAATADPAKHGV